MRVSSTILALILPLHLAVADAADAFDLSTTSWSPGDPITFYDERIEWSFEERMRLVFFENWIDFNDNFDLRDDLAILQRVRLGLTVRPTESLELFAELQDSRTWLDEPQGPTFNREFINHDNPIDLHRAHVRWVPDPAFPLGFTVGRQHLSFGDERLIGSNDWNNNARAFDAVRATLLQPDFQLDAFSAWPVIPESDDVDGPDTEDLFSGLYLESHHLSDWTADAYLLYRHKTDVDRNTTLTNNDNQRSGNNAPRGDVVTVGTRWESNPDAYSGVDFRVEAALQTGQTTNPKGFTSTVGGQTINTGSQQHLAGAVHAQIGYTFKDVPAEPRLFLEFNYASGDSNPDDDLNTTFQPHYPTPNPLHGQMDRIAWMNMLEFAQGIELQPTSKWTVILSHHLFWLAEVNDPLRNGNQVALGGTGRYGNALSGNPSAFVGHEVDLKSRYHLTRWMSLEAGYAHFFAGDYLRDTAPTLGGSRQTNDADFAYFQLSLSL
ncbi:MAG: alginate export family protein [Verrucomicrobiota bacterium]